MNISCLRIKNNYLSGWRRTENYTGISGAEIAEAGQYGLSIIPALENSYNYKYNGKKLQTELELNVYDYGAKLYDPAIGRFGTMDPMADVNNSQSPYSYAANNPTAFVDPDGEDYRVNIYQDDDGNWHIDISTTVPVSGEGAAEKVEEFNQFIADNADKFNGSFTNEDGTEFQVSVNIEYKVKEESKGGKVEGFEFGDNFMELNNYPHRSFTHGKGGRFSELGNKKFSNDANTAVHETLHMMGLGDRYYEVAQKKEGGTVQKYAKGFKKDIMGGGNVGSDFEISQTHFINWGRSVLQTGSDAKNNSRKINKGKSTSYYTQEPVDDATNLKPE